jgi:hypothetical protein
MKSHERVSTLLILAFGFKIYGGVLILEPVCCPRRRGQGRVAVPRGHLCRHDLRPNSPPLYDLRVGALGCSSAPPPSLPAAWFAPPLNPPLRWALPSLRPPNRSATLPACSAVTPLPPIGRPDFIGKSPLPKRQKSSPASASGRKAPWDGPGRPWPNGLGPFQQYFIYLLFKINSKFNLNLV